MKNGPGEPAPGPGKAAERAQQGWHRLHSGWIELSGPGAIGVMKEPRDAAAPGRGAGADFP